MVSPTVLGSEYTQSPSVTELSLVGAQKPLKDLWGSGRMTAVFQEYLWLLWGGWIREGKNGSPETSEAVGEGTQEREVKAGGGQSCGTGRRGHIGELLRDEKVRPGK